MGTTWFRRDRRSSMCMSRLIDILVNPTINFAITGEDKKRRLALAKGRVAANDRRLVAKKAA